jgi:DNA-binding TFAR19-related protein (PDSD5 family)
VVVSEETGVISLIREGRITKELDEKSLFSALYRLTIYRYQRREKIKKQQKLGEAKPEAVASKDSGDSENGVEGLENDGAKEAV